MSPLGPVSYSKSFSPSLLAKNSSTPNVPTSFSTSCTTVKEEEKEKEVPPAFDLIFE